VTGKKRGSRLLITSSRGGRRGEGKLKRENQSHISKTPGGGKKKVEKGKEKEGHRDRLQREKKPYNVIIGGGEKGDGKKR